MPRPLRIGAVHENAVELFNGEIVHPGICVDGWTLMATVDAHPARLAVFEDFTTVTGSLVMADCYGGWCEYPKSAEPTSVDDADLYLGHTLQEVMASDHDLLAREILARPGDPSFAEVAACIAPISTMETHTFVGTASCPDKVGIAYGGRTPNFDPAVYVPAIALIRKEKRVLDGLVGGWLPVVRFVYPEGEGTWSEFVLFAPNRIDGPNPRIQPVWHRICRVENHELKWARVFDTYPPFPPRSDSPPVDGFYRDLAALRDHWDVSFSDGLQVDLPDRRLADQARHSLTRAIVTRIDGFPKYGVMDRNYGASEHDGFPDTFNVDTTAMLEWGLFDRARAYIDNYFTHFVRDDGSILYRGPETGQYGRMLTVLAEYAAYTGDVALLKIHRPRIDAIADLLLSLRRHAEGLPREDPAYGMIAGWCEADSCLEPDPDRYLLPYFSNSAEAIRGFRDLGRVEGRADLVQEAKALDADLQTSLARSLLTDIEPPCIPAIAGAAEPFDVASRRDSLDPQFRAYRAYMEMLHSGVLTAEQVDTVVAYREARRDVLLGIPAVYGYNSGEMGGFLAYGHAYGLLQRDRIREYLLLLYSLSAHQYTRGHWTAPETRRLEPDLTAAPYAVPAQLTVPLLLRWLLAWEDPNEEALWLARATPRDWLADGQRVSAIQVPTRYGPVAYEVQSRLAEGKIEATLRLPSHATPYQTRLRLRAPKGYRLSKVRFNSAHNGEIDAEAETVNLATTGEVRLVATYAKGEYPVPLS